MTPEDRNKYDLRWIASGKKLPPPAFLDIHTLTAIVVSGQFLKRFNLPTFSYREPYPSAAITGNIRLFRNGGAVTLPLSDRRIPKFLLDCNG